MKHIWSAFWKLYDEMKNVGIVIGDIDDITINNKAKSRWGRCTYHRNSDCYTIEISSLLLNDEVNDIALYNTLAHEMLHTAENCMNHGKIWKTYANIMNETYGYNIKTTESADEKGIVVERKPITYKYAIHCTGCGSIFHYQRESKVVKCCRSGKAHCSCGCSKFVVENL